MIPQMTEPLLATHHRAIWDVGLRVTLTREDLAYCDWFAQTLRQRLGKPAHNPDATRPHQWQGGIDWDRTTTIGERGELAAARAYQGTPLSTPYKTQTPNDPDLRLPDGRTFEIKTRAKFFWLEAWTTARGPNQPKILDELPVIFVYNFQHPTDLIVCGWITKARFLRDCFKTSDGPAVTACSLFHPGDLLP